MNNAKRVFLFIFFVSIFQFHPYAQTFRSPLDIPIYLAATFGEIRTNHFHSGIDIKTEGKEGKPIYAAASGYVSRIKVAASGMGHALYITHPNGYVSVYAHLSRYNKEIETLVKNTQY